MCPVVCMSHSFTGVKTDSRQHLVACFLPCSVTFIALSCVMWNSRCNDWVFLNCIVYAECNHFVISCVSRWDFCYVCLVLFELSLHNNLTIYFPLSIGSWTPKKKNPNERLFYCYCMESFPVTHKILKTNHGFLQASFRKTLTRVIMMNTTTFSTFLYQEFYGELASHVGAVSMHESFCVKGSVFFLFRFIEGIDTEHTNAWAHFVV